MILHVHLHAGCWGSSLAAFECEHLVALMPGTTVSHVAHVMGTLNPTHCGGAKDRKQKDRFM